MKTRILIGWSLFFAICAGSLLFIAYEGNPGNFELQKAIRTNDFHYFDTLKNNVDPLADSCARAIKEKYRRKHIKTIGK